MKEQFDVYQDIKERTGGDMYIGVVGPVRTGKSTFIKRFMETLVLPAMEDGAEKQRTVDELPQSGSGRTITTTEPKFIPKQAAEIELNDDASVKVRLVDCVGYMVDGATGHLEEEKERLVKTPWYDYEIPFTKAAHIGTKKVMTDHATIGILITGDGSYGELTRENFLPVEKELVSEMKALGKPFIVVLNSTKPGSKETMDLAEELTAQYGVKVLPVNCDQLKGKDIIEILKHILLEFPISQIGFFIPKWAETLDAEHPIKLAVLDYAKEVLGVVSGMKNVYEMPIPENEYIQDVMISNLNLKDGTVRLNIMIPEKYYYDMLTSLLGAPVENEYDFLTMLKEVSGKRKEYEHVADAMNSVQMKGYGLVMPDKENITLAEPELIKHGTKYGIKIKASAPSLHFIKANVSTEIAPIVGTEEQAKDFLANMSEQMKTSPEALWKINIFGKTVEQMVEEGLISKSNKINDDSQIRLQDTMEKIINDSNGGMVFIII
ncbi:MAG: stage IV sporulation protein A [Bacteroidales bacterium]|nr:stage IV sporulation protein A [Clostridium sp.]MCM1203038.1 stage IV sporulation protein A [Bacteroidales bacterium]